MRIGRMLYPVRELGPGERLGIWVQGCARKCPGCANPELQEFDWRKEIPAETLADIASLAIAANGLTGITITGGEPMLQPKELAVLLKRLKPICGDVLIFTGFRIQELTRSGNPDIRDVLSLASVVVDGEYILEKNAGDRLRGSTNQRVVILEECRRKTYEDYMSSENRHIDTFISTDGVISVGIHPQTFLDKAWAASGTPG